MFARQNNYWFVDSYVSMKIFLTFYSLDHCILLQRICDLGVGRQAILWFNKNYLSGRVHCVKAGDRYSDWGSMRAGIPREVPWLHSCS